MDPTPEPTQIMPPTAGPPAPPQPPGPPRGGWRDWSGPFCRWPRWRKWLLSIVVLLAALVGGVALEVHRAGAFFFVACNIDALHPHTIGQASYLYSADQVRFATLPSAANRVPVPLAKIDPMLQKGTVAVEDRRFYQEGGSDWQGLLRAFSADVSSGSFEQGGSTLTQQLVRNLYLGQQRTVSRKLREGCLADQLSRRWSKQKVLDRYLNTAYYGEQAYGVESAARTYFSRHATDLTLPQAALLAGLPQAPTDYDPLRNPEAAKARRQVVLEAMLATGVIDQASERQAAKAPLGLKPSGAAREGKEAFFVNYVYDQLVRRYGAATMRRGGLRVYTTLNWHWQQAAEQTIKKTLNRQADPATALVAIDPKSGAVRAMASIVPGRPHFQFNLAAQGRRQAGSSFKPFVLTQAVIRGINPYTTTYLSAPFKGPPGNPYLIQTDTHTYAGKIPLDQATAQSDNTVFVRLTLDLGPDNVAAIAHLMGVKSPLEAVPTLGLGVNPVSPFEMASAYATLAAGGVYHPPYSIGKVAFPDGRLDRSWRRPRAQRVIAPDVAYQVTKVLEEVIAHGTGTAANIGRPAAGKTGTTSSLADAWFDGYTPDLATAVWVGYPKARVPMTAVHGIEVFGGTFPAQIWHDFMSFALAHRPAHGFARPTATASFSRWCGRFQYAPDYAAAKPTNGCVAPPTTTTKTAPTTTQATTSTTGTVTTTPATTTQPPTTVVTTAPTPTTTTRPTTTQAAPPTVPDVTGEDQDQAVSDLRAAGFNVYVNHQATQDQSQDGVVLDQNPQGDTQAKRGQTVYITVGQYQSG